MTFKNIFLNKRPVSCSSSRYHLSINTKSINKQTNIIYVNKQTINRIVVGINLNIINTLTFIKTTFKNIFLNKRYVKSSNFKDQQSYNKKNIDKQTISMSKKKEK